MWTRKAIRLIFMKRIKPLKVIEEKMKIKAKKLVGIISAFAVLIIVSYTSNMFEVDSSSKLSKIIKDMKATKSFVYFHINKNTFRTLIKNYEFLNMLKV